METLSKPVADILRRVTNIENPQQATLSEHQEQVFQSLIQSIGLRASKRLRSQQAEASLVSAELKCPSIQANVRDSAVPQPPDAICSTFRYAKASDTDFDGIITGSMTGHVHFWDKKSTTFDREKFSNGTNIHHSGRITAIASTRTEKGAHLTATASSDGEIKVWRDHRDVMLSLSHGTFRAAGNMSNKVVFAGFHPTLQSLLVTSRVDGTWAVWDAENAPQASAKGPYFPIFHQKSENEITCSDIQCDGALFACGSTDGAVHLWDMRSGAVALSMPRAHNGRPTKLQMHPFDGCSMVTAATDGVLNVWNLRFMKSPTSSVAAHSSIISDVRFGGESGSCLLTGGFDSAVKLWDFNTMRTNSNNSANTPLHVFPFRGKVNACEIVSDVHTEVRSDESLGEIRVLGASGSDLKMWNASLSVAQKEESVYDEVFSDEDELEMLMGECS